MAAPTAPVQSIRRRRPLASRPFGAQAPAPPSPAPPRVLIARAREVLRRGVASVGRPARAPITPPKPATPRVIVARAREVLRRGVASVGRAPRGPSAPPRPAAPRILIARARDVPRRGVAALVRILGPTAIVPPPPPTQTFRVALRAKLLSLSDLTAIVGSAVYPGALPQTHDLQRDGPALTYTVTKFPRGFASGFGHVLSGSDGTILARVMLSAWGFTFSEVDAISVILFDRLDGIRNATDWGNGTIEIMSCVHGQELDLPQPVTTGRGWIVYEIASEYEIRYRPNPLPDNS